MRRFCKSPGNMPEILLQIQKKDWKSVSIVTLMRINLHFAFFYRYICTKFEELPICRNIVL